MTSDRPRIKTDFNDLVDDYATALVAGRIPEPGQIVELFDPDGNTCLATVDRIDNSVLYLRPFWESWKDGGYVADLMSALRESLAAAQEAQGELQDVETAADPAQFVRYA